VDVLKLKPGCPFLDASFRCTIKDVKVVLCEVYPVVFDVVGDEVQFSVDPWCRSSATCRAERYLPAGRHPALRRLQCPTDWYRAVACTNSLCVDYDKLFALRPATSATSSSTSTRREVSGR